MPNLTEKQIETKLRDKAKKLGGKAYKFVSPGNSGVPDRIVVLPGRKIGFAELKAPGKTTRKTQELQIKFLKGLGFLVGVIDSCEGVDNFLKELMG